MTAIVYCGPGPWGGGKGSRLTVFEHDGSIYNLDQRMATIEGAGGPLELDYISSDGTSLFFHLTDSSTQGPFPLPVAVFKPAGEWQNSFPYVYLNVVSVRSLGVFLVLRDHTTPDAPAEFDPDAVDEFDNPLYTQIAGLRDVDYDIAFCVTGSIPGDGTLLGQVSLRRAAVMAADLAGAQAYLAGEITDLSVDTLVFTIQKNHTAIGTVTFTRGADLDPDGGQFGTFDFPDKITFAAGDRVRLLAPDLGTGTAGDDTSATDLSVTLPATRLDI
jgi:hypothetical protein